MGMVSAVDKSLTGAMAQIRMVLLSNPICFLSLTTSEPHVAHIVLSKPSYVLLFFFKCTEKPPIFCHLGMRTRWPSDKIAKCQRRLRWWIYHCHREKPF